MPAWKDDACVDYLSIPACGRCGGRQFIMGRKGHLPEHVHSTFRSHGHIVTFMPSVIHGRGLKPV